MEPPTGNIPNEPAAWSSRVWAAILLLLTLSTLLIHGYHPLAEDGGVYAAGVYLKLDPSLFPQTADFVRAPMHYSLFASAMAAVVRLTHVPVLYALFLAHLSAIWLTLFAARQVLRRCGIADAAQLGGVTLLAVWWTLPIAGTSLVLMDPYVTARSFSTPLTLLALVFALDRWPSWNRSEPRAPRRFRSILACALCLLLAACVHLLMAAYALAFVILLRAWKSRRPAIPLLVFSACAVAAGAFLQAYAPPESAAWTLAENTRSYWYLARWQWYEILGLAGPLAVLALLHLRSTENKTTDTRALLRCCLTAGFIAIVVALLFARESAPVHLIARLQPLRVFLPIYAVMAMLLGSVGVQAAHKLAANLQQTWAASALRSLSAAVLLALAVCMGLAQRGLYTNSPHLELPWRAAHNTNPWEQAFLWARANTSPNALFAMDAHYITSHGEDAQTFRAAALRDAIPDYSKDGGESSITPSLAARWLAGVTAQLDLDTQSDVLRQQHLEPLHPDWLVLRSAAATALPCPYNNGTVKLCRLRL